MTDRSHPNRTTAGPPCEHSAFIPRSFQPARWLPGPHLQTVFGKFLRPRSDPGFERIRVETPDGDFLDLDLCPDPASERIATDSDRVDAETSSESGVKREGVAPKAEAPVVLVLHGLEGSTARRYMRVAMTELAERGLHAVGMNFRSCSGEPNRRARFYHSGDTEDLALVLDLLHHRFPTRSLGALGFSLGGNVLLRFLGERAETPPSYLRGAAAISVPFNLTEGIRALEANWMGRVYTRYFLRSLRAKSTAKRALLEPVVRMERVMSARTLREFDDAATAPLHGFPDAWTYYQEASSAPLLPRIRVPTYLLHALDDPFLPEEFVPETEVKENAWLTGSFPASGGHVGFVEGDRPWRSTFWAEAEAARYLATVLKSG